MGTFHVTIEIGDPVGQRFESVDALVDTGATYSVIPAAMLRSLAIESIERGSFELADGTLREFELGETRVRVHGTEVNTVVVFGDENTEPLLGAYTLERLRLAVDPVRQRLISVPGRLM
jgi:clan AA aspartic protease